MALADLTAWRDRLKDARYSGVREVLDASGERIAYKSDGEMAKALAALEAEILAASSVRRSSIIRFQTSKGV